jgi:hypothetical protein
MYNKMKSAHHRKRAAATFFFLFHPRSGAPAAAFCPSILNAPCTAGAVAVSRQARVGHLVGSALCAKTKNNDASMEAARLLARAKEIRESIPEQTEALTVVTDEFDDQTSSTSTTAAGYRLYCDVGREDGTWMDPRWGASGRRVEFTVDVEFALSFADEMGADGSLANDETCEKMVKDNFGGKSSQVRTVKSLKSARLRGGFDEMRCNGGGYRIDVGGGNSVCRFFLECDGTPKRGGTFGDVWIPKGCLYFSIPCFGNSVTNLSAKEGPITVRQIGWHTGWRREESRIVGVFRAKKLEEARKIDKY